MKIVVPEFGVCHVNDAAVQPAKQVDSLLAVSCPPIFRRDDGVIEYLFTAIKSSPWRRRLVSRFRSSQVTTRSKRSYKKSLSQGLALLAGGLRSSKAAPVSATRAAMRSAAERGEARGAD